MEYTFTSDNFEEEVLKSDVPVLVDMFATWCGPCKMMAPVVAQLAEEYEGTVKVGKLDIDQNVDTQEPMTKQEMDGFLDAMLSPAPEGGAAVPERAQPDRDVDKFLKAAMEASPAREEGRTENKVAKFLVR